jgi:RNA polymerase sigma-70 factor (ECF subfamily)
MATTMTLPHGSSGSSLETRPSLLKKLQSGDDPQSWQEFYRIYGGLIRSFALKAGLTADEAEEVVQETAIGVARRLPEFVYDPKVCRFKSWLLNLTRWRIQNQIKKRMPVGMQASACPPAPAEGTLKRGLQRDGTTTGTIEGIADPAIPELGGEWDAVWEQNLLNQAMERVRQRIDERQFQIFDLFVTKGWPGGEVAKAMKVSIALVYVTRFRVTALLKQEVRRLEKAAERCR